MANSESELTKETFDRLLDWLDADRERAARRYEEIRRRLIKIFACRGCHEAEDLADETINRVTRKLTGLADTYTGDPSLYFYGVASKVHQEYLRKRARPIQLPPPAEPHDEIEREYECLERCMQRLTPDSRELVIQYYREEKQAKIDCRKRLAEQFGIALNALRIRAFRTRATLQECVRICLEQGAA